jgi:hypothetical protein
MGCDLHAMVYSDEGYGPEAVVSFNEPRDYRLFWSMAGVRYGEGEPVAPPRGLPDYCKPNDECYVQGPSYGDFWIGDHSYSWLTPDEFAEALKRAEGPEPYKRDPIYYAVLALMRSLAEQGQRTTLVFGFDN